MSVSIYTDVENTESVSLPNSPFRFLWEGLGLDPEPDGDLCGKIDPDEVLEPLKDADPHTIFHGSAPPEFGVMVLENLKTVAETAKAHGKQVEWF